MVKGLQRRLEVWLRGLIRDEIVKAQQVRDREARVLEQVEAQKQMLDALHKKQTMAVRTIYGRPSVSELEQRGILPNG